MAKGRTQKKTKTSTKRIKTSVTMPEELWKEGRIQAIREVRDFQDVLTEALREYLQRRAGKEHG